MLLNQTNWHFCHIVCCSRQEHLHVDICIVKFAFSSYRYVIKDAEISTYILLSTCRTLYSM